MRFSPLVSPVCLPRPHTRFSPSSVCHVAGWGRTQCKSERAYLAQPDLTLRLVPAADGIHSECLRSARIPLIEQESCVRLYSNSSQPIIPEMMCAGRLEGGVDACKGDSGGPLVCKENPDDGNDLI